MVLSRRFFAMRGVLLVMKTPEDERYVVISVPFLRFGEILLYYHILRVRRIPTYRVYRFCDRQVLINHLGFSHSQNNTVRLMYMYVRVRLYHMFQGNFAMYMYMYDCFVYPKW